jgi:hypothetical protein
MPIWEVQLFIYGPVTTKVRMVLNEPKGFRLDDQFHSNIELNRTSSGVSSHVTARAETSQLARKAALFFFGQMLDVLAVQIDQPMYISLHEKQPSRSEIHHVRRIVEREEWHSSFSDARSLSQTEPTFLRAMGWYRKGLYTEDPFDKFLAFWNAIEIVATKYRPKNEASNKGSKSQIWECYKLLWGKCEQWPIIPGDKSWIDDNHEMRTDIAHGIASVDVRRVEMVLAKLNDIQKVAHKFLSDWKDNQLNLQHLPVSESNISTQRSSN